MRQLLTDCQCFRSHQSIMKRVQGTRFIILQHQPQGTRPRRTRGDQLPLGVDASDGNDVKRVLLTGMSGVGKSTVIEELAARGYMAIDTDYGGLSELVSVPNDEPTGLDPGLDWVWREGRIQDLLSTADADVLFLGGCAPNQGTFYPQFDHIILLTAPVPVILERLATRTTNPYGKRPEEAARVLDLVETIEPLLRRGAGHVVDTSDPLDQVVARVLRLVGERV
jgi:shikimate kinase